MVNCSRLAAELINRSPSRDISYTSLVEDEKVGFKKVSPIATSFHQDMLQTSFIYRSALKRNISSPSLPDSMLVL